MIMKGLLTGLLLLCLAPVIAQRYTAGHVDTLRQKVNALKPGRIKFRIEQELFRYDLNTDPKRALALANSALAEAEQLKNDTAICLFTDCAAEVYIYLSNYQKALVLLNKDYDLAEKDRLQWQMALALTDMSAVYQGQSDYINAEAYSLRSLRIYEALKDYRQMAICDYNLGVTFNNNDDFKKAIFYGQHVLALKNAIAGNDAVIPNAYLLIGTSLVGLGNYSEARKYYNAALVIYNENKNEFGIANVLSQLLSTYPGQYQKQIGIGQKAQQLWNKIAPENFNSVYNLGGLGNAYGNLAIRASDQKKQAQLFSRSQGYFADAIGLAKKTNNKAAIIDITDSLSLINAAMGDYKDAYNHLRTSKKLNDSVYSQNNKNKIAALEGAHEISLRDKQLAIRQLQVAAANKQKLVLLAGMIVLVIIAGLIYFQSLQRRRMNTQLLRLNHELDEANKVKTKFFNIINHDIRAPIAGFVNFLQLQRKAPDLLDRQTSDAYAQQAITTAENLLMVMEDLLLWSKGQMENFKPDIRQIEVTQLFNFIRQLVRPYNAITFEYACPADMKVNSDEHYLKTIMYNLTNNAIKVLKDTTGPRVIWTAWAENNVAHLSIRDNGPGANEEAFRALYDDKAPIGIKSGLGMHIIRDLTKAVNCKIEVIAGLAPGIEIRLIFN